MTKPISIIQSEKIMKVVDFVLQIRSSFKLSTSLSAMLVTYMIRCVLQRSGGSETKLYKREVWREKSSERRKCSKRMEQGHAERKEDTKKMDNPKTWTRKDDNTNRSHLKQKEERTKPLPTPRASASKDELDVLQRIGKEGGS